MKIEALYNIYKQYPLISTDTRNIKQDSVFFALKGASFDGNAFAEQALLNGARYAVVDNPIWQKDDRYILVDDVLVALQKLAEYHRDQLDIPIIGITGTNGKTTSKELLYAVLSQRYKTFATLGNLNNHIGVPLSILSISKDIEIAIIEMGANHLGEISFLSKIAKPTHGLITNVGKAHLEGFGSFEGVKIAKGELYDYLQDHHGILFLQGDNIHLVEMAKKRHIDTVVQYGFSAENNVIGKLLIANPYLAITWKERNNSATYEVSTNLTGSYNTENFLAAIAVGLHFGVDPIAINTGIAGYIPKNNRSQITKTDRNTVIADFYNANASSMAAALDNMKVLSAERKVLVLGDMFELGEDAYEEHALVIQKAKELLLERLIFVGKEFYKHKCEGAEFYESTTEALIPMATISGCFVLLKASRGMSFERLLEVL
ncbi:UDP-N-acetylmuramoyl-tripeptide--D-alanyl-D-alanine ligase [Sphingobacterium yanglingense]|uniref:UDP-N-acetylmuramoyl-tripeptide--D-alanyl-D-alanine ligase n=1 Tax=Sphingobacterium yanglingense TaxID=1437280 RepID=A0A4R6W1A6_9SPHI|nr:UDP-N-acetylmuramoyl-tripeptide--D-alanyl-D-alanine ligase [Sphingobacterium yanglingense]TDQ72147.1 UDP-N-acetylmuramoyl-tripeptide--D-alanyl-D-alanine ligase [Sphingobacterium yanglingense]